MPKKKKQSSLDSRSVFRAADIAISPSHAIVVKYVVGRSLQCTRDAAPGSNIASEKLLEQKLSSIFLLYSEKKKNKRTNDDGCDIRSADRILRRKSVYESSYFL